MSNQEDIDSLNNKLYSSEVPSEPIKKVMFYFAVLKEVIDFPFPENYINYEHPYFESYEQMEEFFALSKTLDPTFLYYNNVIIYHNDKNYYKYYQINDDQNGKPYEFKVVDIKESTNPIFNSNYNNSFNISNIDKNQVEFNIKVSNKSIILHTEDNLINTVEDDYLNDCKDEEKVDLQSNNTDQDDSIDGIVDSECANNDQEQNPNYRNNNQKKGKEKNKSKQKSSKHKKKKNKKNRMDSEDELDFSEEKFYTKKVTIKHKLIVTNDWIDFIYNDPQKELLKNMKKAIKKDEVRSKSISLPKNVFFYLEILMLVLLALCSWVLFSMSSTLKNDQRFISYKGEIKRNQTNQKENGSLNFLGDEIDYKNDTIIVPELNKYKKINKGCKFGQTTAIFATIFLVFLIYMCIRVSREKKAKYKKKEKAKKAGLNICHFVVFILLTLLCFIMTLVSEIYIIVAISQKTYNFIHDLVRNQLILNSLLFACYLLIVVFYCKI